MPIIKAKKFILRPIDKDDAKLIAEYANDRDIHRNTLLIPHPYALKDAKWWISRNLARYKKKKKTDYVFTIEIDENFAGAVGLHEIIIGHKAELGYWLGRKFWGQGIMSEAVKKVCDYGFKEFKLKRIYAKAFPWNKASMKVMEKAGMKYEGILRADAKKNGKFLDHHLYAKINRMKN